MFVYNDETGWCCRMGKKTDFDINCDSIIELGIEIKEAVEYLEKKKASTIHPVHVKALLLLKQPVASS
jgi:hypothetical protein